MGTATRDIYGSAGGEPATPGTYGIAPKGYRLPAATRLGEVVLRVADLGRSVDYYTNVLGLSVVERSEGRARLATQDGKRVLVELREVPGVRALTRRARLGLYHFAILLPDRSSLGRFVQHLAESNVYAGAGDHLVSEAFYLQDPDGLGIEVYADRPRDTWRRVDRELMMATDPVDTGDLVKSAGGRKWTGMPSGTAMGHVHLHVGNIDEGAAFYSDALGLDKIAWSYPGALFMSAGGYHHHLGTNTWAGPTAVPPAKDDAAMIEWVIELPDVASVDEVAASIARGGFNARREGTDVSTADPWGTGLRIRSVA